MIEYEHTEALNAVLKYLNEQAKRFNVKADTEETDRLIKVHQEKYGSSFKQY